MIVMPIVYVRDMAESIAFYEQLGLRPRFTSSMWTELESDRSRLALHGTSADAEPGTLELAMVAEDGLADLAGRLREHGTQLARDIADESFGRSFVVRDPNGRTIQVNEHDPEFHS